MKQIFFYLALPAYLTIGICCAYATDFPVSTVAQITTALSSVQPGDTITMTNKIWQDADILFKKNGNATNPITLRAQTPGRVILSGASRLRIAGRGLVVDGLRFQFGYVTNSDAILFRESSSSLATNCALINCSVVDYSPPLPPSDTSDYKWVSIYGISNRVENCYIKGKTNSGTTLVVWLPSGNTNASNYHIIRRNYFGPRPDLGLNGGETIRIGDSATALTSSRTLLEENYFYKCNGEVEIISSKSCDNVYRYNTFDSCEGALTLRHGNRCWVQGNFFLGRGLPRTGGVRIIGENHQVFNNYFEGLAGADTRSALTMMAGIPNSQATGYFQVSNALVAFNTFFGCSNNFTIGYQGTADGITGTQGPVNSTIANNIIRGMRSPLISIVISPTNFLWQSNFFSGATVGYATNGISTNNPLLAFTDGLWRPATNSPALGVAAESYSFVTNDIDGQSRPAAKDVGCDQASSETIARRPVSAADVGPAWMRSVGAVYSAVFTNNSVTLAWNSLPGLTYQIQYSSNLVNWSSVSQTVSNMASTASWTDNGSLTGGAPGGQARRFYRIALLP